MRFLRYFQEMFPELGDDECPLLRLNNHAPPEAQPPQKQFKLYWSIFVVILNRYLIFFQKFI